MLGPVLAAFLLAAPATAQDAKPTVEEEIASFRDSILAYYGFTVQASSAIRSGVRIEIEDWASNSGGGSWDPEHRTVRLRTLEQASAVRTLAMAWWEGWRKEHPDAPLKLAEAVARMAKDAKSKAAAALARSYLKEGRPDSEIFGGLAAWTMGRHRSGPRGLPDYVAVFLDPLFTGRIYRTPYYEGGIP